MPLFVLVAMVNLAPPVAAQISPRPVAQVLQVGLAAIPGAGVVAGYVSPRGFYTIDAVVYVDATPSFSGGEGSLLASLGIGGSIRPMGVVRMIANAAPADYEVDLGVRVGPSLFFPYGESSRRRNPFSLFIEPFARATAELGRGRTYFVELGIQRPILRAGVWWSF